MITPLDPASESNEADFTADYRQSKRRCLIILIIAITIYSIVDAIIPVVGLLRIFLSAPAVVAILCWCVRDAEQHGRRLGTGMRFLILILAPVGVVVYLLSRGRLRSLGLAFLFFLGTLLIAGLSGAVAHRLYAGQWGTPEQW